jgi:hypothetical protein
VGRGPRSTPPRRSSQAQARDAATNAFVASSDDILLIGAIVLFVAAVLTFALVRRSDFAARPGDEPENVRVIPVTGLTWM